MKRIQELTPLSKDHHASLVLAKRCKRVAVEDDEDEKQALIQQIVAAFPTRWERHFEIEELTLFPTGKCYPGEIADLIGVLESEHSQIRALYQKLKGGDHGVLAAFGELLGDHTRKEERELFELAQRHFSQSELSAVYTESLK